MSNRFVETSHTGFFSNLWSSIVGVLFGILLFFGSFIVLFLNEGRTDYSALAKKSAVADPSATTASGFVSVTGPITGDAPLGDPEFVRPGDYIELTRVVEMFAWTETKSSKSKKTLGGGTTTETTYEYKLEWTSDPKSGEDFKDKVGHLNSPLRIKGASFRVATARVGAWPFNPAGITLPTSGPIPVTASDFTERTDRGLRASDEGVLYDSPRGEANAQVGDVRVSFRGIRAGAVMSAFGDARGGELVAHDWSGTSTIKVYAGDRNQAIATMKSEYKMLGWVLRVVGFLMMWIGMTLCVGPLQAIADVIPFVGKATGFIVGLITFPLAFVLTLVTVIVSMLLHSLLAMILLSVLIAAGFVIRAKMKSRR